MSNSGRIEEWGPATPTNLCEQIGRFSVDSVQGRNKTESFSADCKAWTYYTRLKKRGFNFDLGLANFLVEMNPRNAIQLGCGTSLYTEYLVQAGVQGSIIELGPNDMSCAGVLNKTIATYPLQPERSEVENSKVQNLVVPADLVFAVEVSEHVEEKLLPIIVSILSKVVRTYLLFSGGRPGQKEWSPPNVKPQTEWINLFEREGLVFMPSLTKSLQMSCDSNNRNHRNNGFVMGRNMSLDRKIKLSQFDRTVAVSLEQREQIAGDIFPDIKSAIDNVAQLEAAGTHSDGRFPRIIWMFWDQGWEEAPWIVRECASSWVDLNPSWNVTLLDRQSLRRFIQTSEIPIMGPKMKLQGYTDLVRLLLLKTHGGVWVDATVYCRLPLKYWLFKAMRSDFFAFRNPRNPHGVSSWFLASKKNGLVVEAWYSATLKEYENPAYDGYYYFMHREFQKLQNTSNMMKLQWRHVQLISAEGPHFLQRDNWRVCHESLSAASKQIVDNGQVPMFKLSWKVPCLKNSNISMLPTFLYLKQAANAELSISLGETSF
eukprot:CAMPEP_0183827976 /NCGR_PEP_ID=MMETSP0807_2-20130328/2535_1 /TAXON_ID=88271 /ORGANISM="Picocystis salinarum, Strain CCMP1897" /LENGTH=542 /DNA_ID=CAMNT_0026073155 /DNA_START=654 /DNA_END=2282 /DNA_ORIENTATION=-